MSRLGKIARRTFLVGSTAVAGGVAFGYYSYKKPLTNPLLADLDADQTALTPYLRIDQSGITIITPRVDMGQGAQSIQAALIAEEMDLDLAQVKVDHGPPSSAYYNGAVVAEGFPIAATNYGFVARNARAFGDVVGKLMGLQITGGSSTVPDAFDKMRKAGAVARATLVQAAANRTGIEVAQLKTERGGVVLPDGSRIDYMELAPEAAEIDQPSEVTLKPQSAWRILGRPVHRIDVTQKSTGTARYGIDIEMPGMVYATVRTNPRLGGEMLALDASAAEQARGVIKIEPVTGGVAVIADNTWRALQASNMIDFDWGPAPYPAEQGDHWDAVAAAFTPGLQDSRFKDEGDVDAALSSGDGIAAEYRVPYLAHAPLEPLNATVLFKDGRLDIWTSTQIPLFVMDSVSHFTGLAAEDIHLHVEIAGGSFGRRLEDDFVRQAVEIALVHPNVPIKMTWSREEDMTHDFPRPLAIARGRGAVSNWQVTSFDLGIASPSVTQSQTGRLNQSVPGPDIAIVAGAWDQPFGIENYRVTGYRAPPLAPVSSWRSVGASGNGFFHEGFLDELIHAAGADPLEERLRLCWHEPSRKVLEAVGEMSNWGSDPGPNRGRGVAFTLSFGVPSAQVIEVSDTPDGLRIDRVFAALEVGRVLDPINFENQVQGGIIWGLGHAMQAELTYADGQTEQENFDLFETMRLYQAPEITVRGLENDAPVRGVGEPSVPPAAPALANAIFAATGQRIRELPLNKHIDFV
ncbi:MAG: xanthine dehydrogenase family protein molybdopterin-binding subunit [Litoreibacter sp.]|nr:xanthine dehydrogenase family protein molybdopterin-binding subunit [Litoreibacter sp.]